MLYFLQTFINTNDRFLTSVYIKMPFCAKKGMPPHPHEYNQKLKLMKHPINYVDFRLYIIYNRAMSTATAPMR